MCASDTIGDVPDTADLCRLRRRCSRQPPMAQLSSAASTGKTVRLDACIVRLRSKRRSSVPLQRRPPPSYLLQYVHVFEPSARDAPSFPSLDSLQFWMYIVPRQLTRTQRISIVGGTLLCRVVFPWLTEEILTLARCSSGSHCCRRRPRGVYLRMSSRI